MRVFIAGAGTMGAGIAQVFAQAGHTAVLYDITIEAATKGIEGIDRGLTKLVEKAKLDSDLKVDILSRINGTADLTAASDCDLAIEAIIEQMPAKKELFGKLDKVCKPGVIIASNTSSISITELAAGVNHQSGVIGMHFFNPAPVMKLIEVIRGYQTSDETFDFVFTLAKELGKEPVEVKETPGFVVNKILIPMINEAACVLEQGVASAPDIDKAMTLGANHPIGPLALGDLIGNDVVLSIMDSLFVESGDTKYRASILLRKMVRAGKLGRKSGSGFFDYGK